MGGIGIVNNPGSRRNRRRPRASRRLRALLGDDGQLLDASTPEELARALEAFRAAGVDLLGVCGGDGTAHRVLGEAVRIWGGEALPPLLLLPAGGMNLVARGAGVRGSPERVLRAALARRREGGPPRTVQRDLLRVSADGAPPVHGFLFGTGAIVSFLEAYEATGRTGPATAAWLVGRGVASALVGGRFATSLARRARLRVVTDGDEWPDASYLALAAGSTPDAGFGFLAFARCLEQPGSFHVVGVTGSLLLLARALPRLRRGAPWRRRVAQDEIARALLVEGERPRFTVDGDLYDAERSVLVETGSGVEIVVP